LAHCFIRQRGRLWNVLIVSKFCYLGFLTCTLMEPVQWVLGLSQPDGLAGGFTAAEAWGPPLRGGKRARVRARVRAPCALSEATTCG